jgi:DNA-binding MarR family transcriptional regulator
LRRRQPPGEADARANTPLDQKRAGVRVTGRIHTGKLIRLTLQFTLSYATWIGMKGRTDDQRSARASDLAQELRALFGKLKRRLRDQAHIGDLTPSQTSVLLRLEKDGPATASNLARAEGMRPQSMGPLVAALEAAGLVSGASDPSDGRQTILSLTDACRKWIEEGRAARQDWLTRTIQARLSPQEQEDLAASVELLKRLVDD